MSTTAIRRMDRQQVYESARDTFRSCSEGKQPMAVAVAIAEAVGLCDHRGRRYTREDGAPRLGDRTAHASDFHPEVLAEAMIGRNWKQVLGLENSSDAFPTIEYQRQATREGVVRYQEETGVPIGPSIFANVAAWSATVGGLMQAQFLLGYEQAKFDVKDLFPIRPAVFWQGGERYIDILGPYVPAPPVGPGEDHPDMSMSALWVQPGPMLKYGGKIQITKETAAIDISGGQIMARAMSGGQSLAFRENELALDVITGQTNNWQMGMLADAAATGYNTYGPSVTAPNGITIQIPNDNVNPLNDIAAFTNSDTYRASLYHPVTQNPIEAEMNVCLLPTPLAEWARWLQGADEVSMLNQTTAAMAQPAPGTFPTVSIKGKNPFQNVLTPVVSRWLHQRHTASATQADPNRSPGLGLTGNAIFRWYRLDPSKFACRRQFWGATSVTLSPNDWVMATQAIIAGQVFNIATQVQVLSPYHIQRNKSA